MSWFRIAALSRLFGDPADAEPSVERWSRAAARDPDLQLDLITMGGIMSVEPVLPATEAGPPPICPYRLAKAEGRKEMACELLALMGTTAQDLVNLTEQD